ncbi:hypothetical protein V6N12_042836 [Hibiscus sabdariffa]|uniref:Chloride channel protein n=1 Tax=Hibiscus sabdariffa TaxID=183260 RepID=A0ABR2AUZ1_9ROSI
MIILASVISSTVSNALLGTESAFTVPSYDLKSAAELPLYLILGCFEKFGLPTVICPALGGLGAGIIALNYPGILYWGFTNVNEILHTGKSASAPGIWLLTQLAAAKVVATALCKGSGLVGGLYAPSLMIGAAVGAVFGGSAAQLINSAIPGNAAVAQPQAYALVGMAATLASVCSVPLTSVLLLFELTKDYRILLPLMGAVGLAIWVPSVANQHKDTEASDMRNSARGYSSVSAAEELSVIDKAADLEALDRDMLLEDLRVSRGHVKEVFEGDSTALDVNACLVSSVCTKGISYRGQERGVLTCFPDTDLAIARELMEASGVKQLLVVKRGGEPHKGRKRRVIAVLHYDSIWNCLRDEINHRKAMYQHAHRKDNEEEIVNANGH